MSLGMDNVAAAIENMDFRGILLQAAEDGQTARCAATMNGSTIGDIMMNAIQAGRLARLNHFVVVFFSAARLAAYAHANWFDVECYQLNKEQIDLIVAALTKSGYEVTVWERSSVLKKANATDVKNETTPVLRIQTFPPHVREHVAPIWQNRLAAGRSLAPTSHVDTNSCAPAPSEV